MADTALQAAAEQLVEADILFVQSFPPPLDGLPPKVDHQLD